MKRDSFIRYESFSSAIDILPKENQANACKFIIDYGLKWIMPELSTDPVAYAIFCMAKPQLDANNERFLNGQKWWRPIKTWNSSQKPSHNQTVTKLKPNVNDNVNVNVNENVNANENVNENKTKNKKEEKENKKKLNLKVEYSSDFESFRTAYPKKKGKQKAREAWENAIKWGNDPKHLISKAWEYATEIKLKRVEEKFVKYAQGWLNDWRFDDDYFLWNKTGTPDLDIIY